MSKRVVGLSISAVAEEAGVSEALLRAWEQRYGFPTPLRLPSGHRRYTSEHVEQVRQVQRDRAGGLSLDAAISRVRSGEPETSIFAGLRRRRPDLPVHVLSTRAMLAISRAIEDECRARAARPVLIGCFQRERFYRRSEERWRELARTASTAVVLADFTTRRRRARPREVLLAADAPLAREWAVVCHALELSACLAGVERADDGSGTRRFEAVWSVDPEVVAAAAGIGLDLAGEDTDAARPVRHADDPAAVARGAAAVTSRAIAYLDRG